MTSHAPRKLTLPTSPEVSAALGRAQVVSYSLYETPADLARDADKRGTNDRRPESTFYGPDSWQEVVSKTISGDEVAPTDAILAQLESTELLSARRTWDNAIAGYVPNVPSFLAGHPQSMRRRVRVESAHAPIAIIADLTSSAAISSENLAKRGGAILALARLLSQRRPTELWAGSATMHGRDGACAILARIPTTPLNLAEAAHVLASPGWVRRLCYSLGHKDYSFDGRWGFHDHSVCINHAEDILRPAFTHITELCVIPAIHATDEAVTRPVEWIKRYLAQYDAGREAA